MAETLLDYMLARKSAPIDQMTGPAPSDSEIETMIRIAARVPDHGRLQPWRFIVYRGDARAAIGEGLAALAQRIEGPLPELRLEKERTRFTRAPLVIGVVHIPRENPKIPHWEMFLSGGAAAMNLSIAANALGYAANWVTNWFSEEPEGRRLLGLAPHERVIGFVHIGRHEGQVPERPRPDVSAVMSDYSGPYRG